jgi:hypothetical protein
MNKNFKEPFMKNVRNAFLIAVVAFAMAACGGGGGGDSPTPTQTAVVVAPSKPAPLPVKKSSMENRLAMSAITGPIAAPPLPMYDPKAEVNEGFMAGFAVADFFQDGTASLVVATEMLRPDGKQNTATGKIRFYKGDGNGGWVDKTPDLLDDTAGCILPRQAIVADLNNDSKPDVFIACHGYDAPPFPGESPRVLMSQADGRYKNIRLADINCYCHHATAADVDNDGYADVVVTDNQANEAKSFMLKNVSGQFVKQLNRTPTPAAFDFTIEFMDYDRDGDYDLLASSVEVNRPSYIYKGTGTSGVYTDIDKVTLPADMEAPTPYDFILVNNKIYVLRTAHISGYADENVVKIQEIDTVTMAAKTIYTHKGAYSGRGVTYPTWTPFIAEYKGSIIGMVAGYDINIKY